MCAQKKETAKQLKYSYPSYLDLLTEDQFKALEKGILLIQEKKPQEAIAYFNSILLQFSHQPYMLTAICIVLGDIDNTAQAKEIMWRSYDAHKNNGMFLCGLLRLELADGKFEKFEEVFTLLKRWIKKHEQKLDKSEATREHHIEHMVVWAEASYLGVRYCIAQKSLVQAADLIQSYEKTMPEHNMHIALKIYLARALQEVLPNFQLPEHESEFEPFMDHAITQIIEQNREKQPRQQN